MQNIEDYDSARDTDDGIQFIDGMTWRLSLMCEVIASSRRSLSPIFNVWHKLFDYFLIGTRS